MHNFFFVEFHVGNTVHEQSTNAVGTLVHGDFVPGFVELCSAREACGTRAYDSHALARALFGYIGCDPALFPTFVNDGNFDVFDGDGRVCHAQHAGTLAGGWTDATRKFGKVVGFVQSFEGFFPEAAIHEVIPLGNEIVDGTTRRKGCRFGQAHTGMAKGYATVHTSRTLFLKFFIGVMVMKFFPVFDTLCGVSIGRKFSLKFHESGRFSHKYSFFQASTSTPRRNASSHASSPFKPSCCAVS